MSDVITYNKVIRYSFKNFFKAMFLVNTLFEYFKFCA